MAANLLIVTKKTIIPIKPLLNIKHLNRQSIGLYDNAFPIQ